MIPLKLTLAGFMSYREEQTLNFEDDSLWVLIGKNASGKSSIFDAIIFVLFGETRVKGIPNSELVNHHSDNAQITFEFAIGNNKYRVKRTIDKKGKATRQASKLLSKPDGSPSPQPIPLTHKEKEFKSWVEDEIGLNFEVFITSVLLRQGKADEFLESGTDRRYEVLSKLIDLSKYAALEAKAREQKKSWENQAAIYRDNLNRMSPATEQDLVNAQIAIEREDESVIGSRRLVDRLQSIFGQANQWEHLNTDRLETGEKIKTFQSLMTQSEEIYHSYQRLIDLRQALPGLKAVIELVRAIQLEDAVVLRLSKESKTDDNLIRTNETIVAKLESKREQKTRRMQEITAESSELYRRLNELSSVVNMIAQVEQLKKVLELHRIALAKYPDDLDKLLKVSEKEQEQLLEAEQVAVGLSRLANERTKLAEAEQRRLLLIQQLQNKRDARPNALKAKKDAETNFQKVEAHERNVRDILTEAITLLDSVRKHLENFNQIAGTAKCQYCGSELTKDHKAQEGKRLKTELEEKSTLVERTRSDYARAEESLKHAKVLKSSTADSLTQLEDEISSTTRDVENCKRDIQERIAAIRMTYEALPEAYQERVCPAKPASANEWIETIYPKKSDIKELQDGVKLIPRRKADIAKLVEQVGKRNEIQILWTNTNDTLKTLQDSLPLNWKELKVEHHRLFKRQEDITGRLDAAKQEEEEASTALETANRTLREIHDRQNRRSGTLETSKTELQRKRDNFVIQIAQLPESWQTEAGAMTEPQFSKLTEEMNTLQNYEGLHQQLLVADQTLRDLSLHEIEVQEKIDALVAEARRPAEQVNKELVNANEASRLAEGRLNNAKTQQTQLLIQRDQYKETEDSMKVADRNAHLYSILSDQFGEKGIQKVIINKAEIAIVRLSNQMLDNLSGGRSKLRLREAGGNKKALDLEVWDSQTGGDKPILAGLASGSQRFRIAISLALGIGQYIGNESNRIESVIIDEGFGSLDREGRESIIQELHNLSRHLKRIILVSHQEEFSRGFSTGYEVQLVDGASRVRPLVQ